MTAASAATFDPSTAPTNSPGRLIDSFGRRVDYIRVSVTDRCDFRCTYCMAEDMDFLPRRDLLTLEELDRLCGVFIARGTRKIRLTGGEPLMRRNVMDLVGRLSRHIQSGALEELTLTTNGSQLAKHATALAACGVRRVNVSLDSLDPSTFKAITRRGDLDQVLRGVDAAQTAGLALKINMVALKGVNDHEIPAMLRWAHGRGMDLTLIEVMPLGQVDADRFDQYVPLDAVKADLADQFTLTELRYKTNGPARYVEVAETGGRLGFITPMTHTFCDTCNRVRITCTGTLYTCLGQDDATDLRGPLRVSPENDRLDAAITAAIASKPKSHDFVIERGVGRPAVARHMSVTGG